MSLGRLSIRRPIGTMMITLCLVVLGVVSIFNLPVDFLPRIIYPRVAVIANYPGVNPNVIEEEVTKVLERELATTDGIRKIYSSTTEGQSFVWLFFEYGRDIDLVLQDTITKVNLARRNLPVDLDPPRVWKADPSQLPILEFSLSSKTLTGTALRTWADETLVRSLMMVPGVASAEVLGGQKEEVQVVVDFPRLQQLGLTVNDVIRRLDQENKEVGGGRIIGRGEEFMTRTVGRFVQPADLEKVIFQNTQGRKIYLKDFARVVDGGERQRIFAWVNQDEAIKVVVLKQPDANTVEVSDNVHKRVDAIRQAGLFPPDTDLKVMQDQSWFIKNSIQSVSSAIAIGGGLAALVVLLFLGSLRQTFIIGLSIPIALVVTFFLMKLFGLTLNIFSLGALAIGVGMLVDNSTVMLENISRHISRRAEQKKDATEAALDASREVESALWASMGTNLAAIVPFLFISGISGLLFKEMILTISFAMVISLLVGLTLVATFSAKLLTIPRTSGVGRLFFIRAFQRLVEGFTRFYGRFLGRVLRARYLVLGVILASLLAVLPLYMRLGSELLPAVDDHRASVTARFPPGRALTENIEYVRRLNRLILEAPGTESTFLVAGGRLFGRGVREDPTMGSVDIDVDPRIKTLAFVQQLNQRLNTARAPDIRMFVQKSSVRGLHFSNTTHRRDISVQVRGEDLTVLEEVGQELLRRLRRIPGLVNIDRNLDDRDPEFRVHVDRERAAQFGLTVTEVGNTLRSAVDGVIATRLTRGDRQVDVRVRFADASVRSQADLENVSLFPRGGEIIPLRHVARVRSGMGPSAITREDQARMLEIVADVQGRPLGEVARDIQQAAQGISFPPGYAFVPGGEEESLKETNRSLVLLTALAIFLVFVVMAVQYESLSNPLVIIMTVPLALMGGILGLYFTGTPVGATVLLGVILLVGIVVNNAILIVEYIVQRRRDHGVPRAEAVVQACTLRLRPIFMTSFTTIIGLAPLAVGMGEGSEMMRPLGIVVAVGLGFATFITLILTPTLYTVVDDAVTSLRRLVFGAKAPESERRTMARAHVSPAAGADENGQPAPAPLAAEERDQEKT
ncbi:MAG: efflux RND transporter permease subunit [Candidatus Tectomicrobia bacterium]|nr:efflux RND transporter permease subunit [Candidatus Tectomicrobia bacterium]